MRLTIIHDSKGNITNLVAYSGDGPAACPAAKPGELVTQVDTPENIGQLGAQEIFERLSDIVENYRVDVDSKAKLTKKVDSKSKRARK
jgi:hypothetical protein